MGSAKTTLLIGLLAILAFLLGYNYFFRPLRNWRPFSTQETPTPSSLATPSAPPSLIETLSPEEKVAQLMALPVKPETAIVASVSAWVNTYQPGFVTLFGTAVSQDQARDLINQLKQATPATTAPLFVFVDHEGGAVQRLAGEGFTSLPSWRELCADSHPHRMELLTQSARELAAVGVNGVLAPVVDRLVPGSPLKDRACATNPETVVAAGSDALQAYQDVGLLPVLKHFPGIGAANKDLHFAFDSVTVATAEATIYRSLLDQAPNVGVMISHVGVNNQYPDLPCSLSPSCVGELSHAYPLALIISDALDMKAAFHQPGDKPSPSLSTVVTQALFAGDQVLLFSPSVSPETLQRVITEVAARVKQDPALQVIVDRALQRVIQLKTGGSSLP